MSVVVAARYRRSLRYLHWLMFVLVAGAYLMINLHHATPRGSMAHATTVHAHFLFGLGAWAVETFEAKK